MPKLQVGLNCIVSVLLQLIGSDLIRQPNASALLAHVEDDAGALGLDGAQGHSQLRAAVAAERTEGVAGEAFAVDTDEGGLVERDGLAVFIEPADRALAEGEVRLGVDEALVGDKVERAILEWHFEFDRPVDEPILSQAELDEVGHAAHFQAMGGAEFLQVRHAGHRAVVLHDFADDADGLAAGEAGEVDGAFRLPGADEHAAVAGAKGKDVAGADEVGLSGAVVGEALDRQRPVGGADAGGHAGRGVDRDGEVGSELAGGRVALRVQAEALGPVLGHGHADQPPGEPGHEVDQVGRDLLGGADDVAFILAVLVVDEHDHLAGGDVFQDLFNRGKAHSVSPSSSKSRPL